MATKTITERTRKRLWTRADNRCAFPDCGQRLLEPTADKTDDTIIGEECHIVAKKNSPTVARSVCLLSEAERTTYAKLIEDRHCFDNLVLMCPTHGTMIDHVPQSYSVAQVLEMKRVHQETVDHERAERRMPESSAEGFTAGPSPAGTVRLLVLDDVPQWERKSIKRLAKSEPDAWQWLCSELGEPPDADRVVALIDAWPERLAEGSFDLAHALLRLAEGRARWTAAADVWQHLADRTEGALRADHFVCAAVDAKIGGDSERYAALLDQAELVDPSAPRLQLVRQDEIEHGRSPNEQLEFLETVHSEDPALASIICLQRARAAMLIPDVDLAETHLIEAGELDPESIAVRAMRVNLRVQRARIALHDDRDFPLDQTLKAKDEALALRDELMKMGRWEESARLLMLAGDVPALLRDFAGAREVIEQARPEELTADDGAVVLGEAALRVAATDLALALTADAERTDAIRRIRASATIDVLNRPDATSLGELSAIALGGGPESENAAIARLVACLPPVKAPWDDDVAGIVQGVGAERFVPSLRIYQLASTDHISEARELADRLPETMWAAELQLRVAGPKAASSILQAAAEKFLRYGPDASGRLLAADALGRAGFPERSGELLVTIAHEANAAPLLRSNAFAMLLKTHADRDLWDLARSEFAAWKQLGRHLPHLDERISEWEVRIANHTPKAG